jgi:hypothetical protein
MTNREFDGAKPRDQRVSLLRYSYKSCSTRTFQSEKTVQTMVDVKRHRRLSAKPRYL